MLKKFWNHDVQRWALTILQILGFVAFIFLCLFLMQTLGITEGLAEEEYETAYVICMPGDVVNIRSSPSTRGENEGRLEPGDKVQLDGKKRNGYRHCVGLSNESGDGWVHAGYLVDYKPELVNRKAVVISKGRLAARRYIGGKVRKWLKKGSEITVYYWSEDWCCTSAGYIMSKYITLKDEEE